VVVVTGPSGVGKGTLIRALRGRVPGLALSVSATTRRPRPDEIDGRDYHFLSPQEFERRQEEGEFLEQATYAGKRYATPRSELDRLRPPPRGEGARALVLEIELQGARQVREALPDALQVFVAPPSLDALRARLAGRGSDSPAQIEERLRVARRELDARSEFRHVIVNDRLERAVEELVTLVGTILGLHQPRGAPK
jgi:guanylate kinase